MKGRVKTLLGGQRKDMHVICASHGGRVLATAPRGGLGFRWPMGGGLSAELRWGAVQWCA